MPELHDFQKDLVNDVRKVYKANTRIMIQAATSFGKTFVMASMVDKMAQNGMKCVCLVPRLSLIKQMEDEFEAFGISKYRMSKIHCDFKTDYSKNIIIASTASFIRKEFMPFDVIHIDEAHMQNRVINKRMEEHPEERFFGWSASPFSKGLGKYFSAMVKGIGMRSLIDMEGMALCDYSVFAPSIPSLKDIKVKGGEYVAKELEALMGDAKIAGDLVSNWVAFGENRPTMVLPVNVRHANQIQADFAAVGVSSEVISAKTPLDEREAIFDRIRNDTLKMVISCGCLTAGFSIKKISCLIQARPTKSKSDWLQGCGRVLRYLPGKRAIIFDHGGCSLTLGLPECIDIDELDDGKRQESEKKKEKEKKEIEALPKVCKQCGFVKPAGVGACPRCGHISKVCEDVETNHQLGLEMIKGEKKKEPTKEDKQKFYSELLGWQKQQQMNGKNVSDGRVSHIYKEKFGVWAKGLDDRIMSPSNELTSFIRSRNIAYSKAMKQKEGV